MPGARLVRLAHGLVDRGEALDRIGNVVGHRVTHAGEHHHRDERVGSQLERRLGIKLEDVPHLLLDLLAGGRVCLLDRKAHRTHDRLDELRDDLEDIVSLKHWCPSLPCRYPTAGGWIPRCSNAAGVACLPCGVRTMRPRWSR